MSAPSAYGISTASCLKREVCAAKSIHRLYTRVVFLNGLQTAANAAVDQLGGQLLLHGVSSLIYCSISAWRR